MKYNLIIWDFNGTLADDLTIGIECINTVLKRRNMKLIDSVDYYRDVFCFPIKDYYKKLGFDFDKEPYDVPANEWAAEYVSREHTLKPTPNARKILQKIKNLGMEQIILSSSELEMLKREIEILGISEYFSTVLGLDNIYAGGKTEMAKKWSEGKSYKALFIGDSLHDFDTAKAIGADCILYSGGHDNRQRLESAGVPIVDDLIDIEQYLY